MSTSPTPTLAEVLRRALDARGADLRVSLPGKVTRYDAARQLVDVQPCIRAAYTDEEDERQVADLPVVCNVPVIFPGAGGFMLTFPVQRGDTVLLVFSDASLDVWLSTGGVVDPRDERAHHLSDAVAIPGLRDFAHARAGIPAGVIAVGREGGTFEGAALGETLKTFLDSFKSWAAAHVHNDPASGVTSAPTVAPTAVPTVASATVKVSR